MEGLEAFAGRGDRRRALFFVGREREIAAVEKICARALEATSAGERFEGATRLVQGAPGAGKTSLLAELARRWGDRALGVGGQDPLGPPAGTPLPVMLEWGSLHSGEEVAQAILRVLAPKREEACRRTRTGDASGFLGLLGLRAGARAGSSTAPPALSIEELAHALPPAEWTRPVCLMVDEIQQAEPEARDVLSRLHQGNHGLPIVPLLAGLGSSQDVLQGRVGLTRLDIDAVHDLGALSPAEACEAVEAMLSEYKVDRTGAPADWPDRLAELSDGWPQHLHNGMRALADGLARAGGRLADVDAGAVLDREEDLRGRAYWARTSPEMRVARCLVAAVLAALPEDGADDSAIIEEVDRQTDANPDLARWRLPEGMNSRDFMGHLVHRGVLQRGPGGLFVCPIPSFRRYLLRYGTVDGGAGPAPGERDGGASVSP